MDTKPTAPLAEIAEALKNLEQKPDAAGFYCSDYLPGWSDMLAHVRLFRADWAMMKAKAKPGTRPPARLTDKQRERVERQRKASDLTGAMVAALTDGRLREAIGQAFILGMLAADAKVRKRKDFSPIVRQALADKVKSDELVRRLRAAGMGRNEAQGHVAAWPYPSRVRDRE
jgi:hypothetical protein